MTAIQDRLALRDQSLARLVAAVEADARNTALRLIQIDRRAVKRIARRYLAWPSRIEEVQPYAQFMSLAELLARLERRLAFRSAFEREANVTLLGARLYARIMIRREREEARGKAAAQ